LFLEPLEDRCLLSAGWAVSNGGSAALGSQAALSAPDSSGNLYVTGYFNGTATFGSTTLNAATESTYVAKVNSSGNFLWAVQMGGSALGEPLGVALDSNPLSSSYGDVYVTGNFGGTAAFGSTTLTSAGGTDVYVCKLDPSNGNVLWAKQAGGTAGDQGREIAVDPSGNVLVAGNFGYVSDGVIGPVSATFGTTTLTGTTDTLHDDSPVFLSKLDANGNFLSSEQLLGGNYDGQVLGLSCDSSGNAYVSGAEYNSNLNSQSNVGFIEKVDPSGNPVWTQNTSTPANADAVVNQDPVTGKTAVYAASVSNIEKLDASNGNVLWSEAVGAPADAYGLAMAVDASGNLYVTGVFSGSGDFDPGSGTAGLTDQATNVDNAFLVKLDPSGNFLSARNMSSTGSAIGSGLALDSSGNIYTAGSFAGTATFDTGTGTVSMTSPTSPTNSSEQYNSLFLCQTTQSTGMIFGRVINDANSTGIPNVTLYLDSGATTTSDAQGYFHFTDLAPGSYTVGQIYPSGYTAVTGTQTSFTASVVAGQAYDTNNIFTDSTPTETRTYSDTTAVKTTPGKPNAISSLSIPDSYTVLGITLTLKVSNPKNKDLAIYLTDPNGTKVFLGSTTQNGTLTYQVPNFDYTSVTGTWTLEVDGLSGGTLNSWSLSIDGTLS
jgi:hypothetical protein